jgi:hypothetical protein
MKFLVEGNHTIVDGLVLRHRPDNPRVDFEISSTRNRVVITGELNLSTIETVNDVIAELKSAWVEHQIIKTGKDPITGATLR